jgi:UDP-N-acetylglucosamine 2-epimerase (non-hydrolysing)
VCSRRSEALDPGGPITLTEGTNRLMKPAGLVAAAREALSGKWTKGKRPALWDGHSAERAARSLRERIFRA